MAEKKNKKAVTNEELSKQIAGLVRVGENTNKRIDSLIEKSDQKFEAFTKKSDQKFEAFTKKSDQKFEIFSIKTDKKFDALSEQIDLLARAMANGFARVDKRFQGIDLRLDKIDLRLNGLENRLDDVVETKASREELKKLTVRVTRVEKHTGLAV